MEFQVCIVTRRGRELCSGALPSFAFESFVVCFGQDEMTEKIQPHMRMEQLCYIKISTKYSEDQFGLWGFDALQFINK